MLEITTDVAVLARLAGPSGKEVLDVGCGSGALVRALCAAGAHAVGIEISERRLTAARVADPDAVGRYLLGRAEQLPFADASLDLVVFMRALHHVPPGLMLRALGEARRVLRHDGAVYVAEPLPEGDFFELTCMVDDERAVRHAALEAIRRAGEVGLRQIKTYEYAVEGRYAGVEAFRELLVGVDPRRGSAFAEREPEIVSAFETLGKPGPDPGERVFLHPMRADLLHRVEP